MTIWFLPCQKKRKKTPKVFLSNDDKNNKGNESHEGERNMKYLSFQNVQISSNGFSEANCYRLIGGDECALKIAKAAWSDTCAQLGLINTGIKVQSEAYCHNLTLSFQEGEYPADMKEIQSVWYRNVSEIESLIIAS